MFTIIFCKISALSRKCIVRTLICDIDMAYGKLTNKLPSVLISHHKKIFISGVTGRSCDFMIYRSNRAGATVTHFWSYHSSRIYICSLFSCLRCIIKKKNQLPVQYTCSTSYFDKLPASLIGMVAKLN